jgi:predicted TIM-barrel fold metal-dependent hydrolase
MTRPCPGPDYQIRPPKIAPPPLSCDTQAHVFGPSTQFPYAAERGYTPPDAPIASFLHLLDTLGMERGVIVHGSAHGSDNSVTLHGISQAPDRLRGIAVIAPGTPDSDLEAMAEGGIRGLRLSTMLKGAIGTDHLESMADRIKHLNWHIVIHVGEVEEIAELEPRLRKLPVDVVIDHLGRVRGGQGVDNPGFQALLRLLRETDTCWTKISSWYRLSDQGAPYDDMTPLAEALISARTDRIIWGSNWPHPILWDYPMPNDGDLLDQFMGWAGDEATIKQILVDNPARLYGFADP